MNNGLRDLLLQLTPSERDKLRTVLVRDDRDEIAAELQHGRPPETQGVSF